MNTQIRAWKLKCAESKFSMCDITGKPDTKLSLMVFYTSCERFEGTNLVLEEYQFQWPVFTGSLELHSAHARGSLQTKVPQA